MERCANLMAEAENMEKLEQKRILQETALLHYKGWQEGMERHSREPLFQMLG